MTRRGWLRCAAFVLLLFVAALSVAVATVDPNDYKPQIAAAVQQATGRRLALGGPLHISRSFWPTIEVSNVELANLVGGTRPDMARAERIEAQVSLLALLQHHITLSKLTLVGPNILFEWVDGRPNWVFDGDASRPSTPSVTLDVQAIYIRNGMVTIRLPTRTHVVGLRALDFQYPVADGPLDLASVLVYSDYQPFLFRAKASPAGGGAWTTRLDAAAYDAALSAEGRMSVDGDYDLQVKGRIPELAKLNALLPPLKLPAVHRVDFASHLTNGPALGDPPVVGQSEFQFGGAELGSQVPGLTLSAMEASLPAAGAAATISGGGRYGEAPFVFGGTIGVPKHLTGHLSTPIDATVRAPVIGKGAQPSTEGNLALKGYLALAAGHFDGLDAMVRLRVPKLADWEPMVPSLPVLDDFSLEGRLALPADLQSIRLQKAALSARAFDIGGDASLELGATPALKAQLRAKRLDLDGLLDALYLPQAPAAPAATEPTRVIPDVGLPWAMLRGKTADLTVSVGAATFRRQVWREVSFALQLAGGRLQVDRLRLALPAGPLEASMSADASRQGVPVSLALHAPGIPFGWIVHNSGLPGEAAGAVRVDTELNGKGSSTRDFAASLDGPFSATMIDGRLSNAALLELASAPLEALGIQMPENGETAIRCFGLIGSFRAGIGRFPKIALNSTTLQLSGAGEVDLGAETLALKLHPMAQLAGASVSVPVVVEGSFRSPQSRLDASGLDKLGLLIDAWFGGDRPQTCSEAGLASPGQSPRR